MWVTTDQAIDIYARYCKARYGGHATTVTRERARELRQRGDIEGERIWNAVTRAVEERTLPQTSSA
jgi:hypothetical protein